MFNPTYRKVFRALLRHISFHLQQHLSPLELDVRACIKTPQGKKEADLVLVTPDEIERAEATRDNHYGHVELVVEINTRHSKTDDWGPRKKAYEALGIPEYWIVEPNLPSITVHRLVEGKYVAKDYQSHALIESVVLKEVVLMPAFLLLKGHRKPYGAE